MQVLRLGHLRARQFNGQAPRLLDSAGMSVRLRPGPRMYNLVRKWYDTSMSKRRRRRHVGKRLAKHAFWAFF